MRRLAIAAFASAALLASSGASAFVSPRWRAHEASLRTAMIGSWQVVGGRHKGSATTSADLDIRLDIDRDTIKISNVAAGFSELAKWSYVGQEGEMVTITVEDTHGKKHEVDVLVETPDALTFYVEDDDGDDEEVIRLERMP
ncbi:MAG: hypothetical protein ACXVEF_34245 [Polyangiales bacterium]